MPNSFAITEGTFQIIMFIWLMVIYVLAKAVRELAGRWAVC
jgi:hypothetical protein